MTVTLEQRFKSDTLRRVWLAYIENPTPKGNEAVIVALDAVLEGGTATTEQVLNAHEAGANDPNPMRAALYAFMLDQFLQGKLDIAGGHPTDGFVWTASDTAREEDSK